MHAFSRLSISAKLFAIVSFLFLVIAVIGGFAFLQMRAINAAAQDIQTQWLPSVRWIGEMRVQSARFRAVLRDHLIVADAERADVDKNLAARKADFEKAAKAYRPLISSPAERELADQLDKQWQSFAGASAEVQSLANKGDVAAAKEINASKVVPVGRAMDATLAKLVELNDKGAEAAGQGAEATYWSAILLMAVILGGAIVLGLGAAIYVVRDIRRGIGSILKPMGQLTDGELSVEIPHQGEATEIGRIASALQIFKEALIAKKASDEAARAEDAIKAARAQRISTATGNFEAMIGELVDSLASASTELEASATTMTKTSDVHDVAVRFRRVGVACGHRQYPGGRGGDRRNHLVGQRDRPPGPRIQPDRLHRRHPGAEDRREHREAFASPPAASMTSSN